MYTKHTYSLFNLEVKVAKLDKLVSSSYKNDFKLQKREIITF